MRGSFMLFEGNFFLDLLMESSKYCDDWLIAAISTFHILGIALRNQIIFFIKQPANLSKLIR